MDEYSKYHGDRERTFPDATEDWSLPASGIKPTAESHFDSIKDGKKYLYLLTSFEEHFMSVPEKPD